MAVLILIYLFGLLALGVAVYFTRKVLAIVVEGDKLTKISRAIEQGAMSFLLQEYKYVTLFALCFAALIAFVIPHGTQTAIAFLAGALVSSLCAFLGMKIAVKGNVRTTMQAQKGLAEAFRVAFHSGAVMGFGLTGLAVLGLVTTALIFSNFFDDARQLMEIVSGFGLGGSTVALFGRVGGGIYTKAADVGADLVGKVESGIPEDDPRNPAVIADNVGDNVGDIAGMGADLFGSCAEATCAALVIGASVATIAQGLNALYYPVLITAVGIPVCLVTMYFAKVKADATSVEPTLKMQLFISTIIMSIVMAIVTKLVMVEFTLAGQLITPDAVLVSLLAGLWAGLLIGTVTEYYTSHAYKPVREVAEASNTGSATNIIYGLSLGYKSAVVPVVAIAVVIYMAWTLAGMYGIAIAAIGMISTIAIGLTIDAYGPVADNAGGIAEMSELGEEVRNRTDTLDAAGNTTAAIGKGFAIGSAVLTALALFGAFLTVANINALDLLSPLVFAGLICGGVLPFLFTAQTMRAVGQAAYAMIEEVRRQFREKPGILSGAEEPDHRSCVAIATTSAIRLMVAPGFLVMFTPLIFGTLFGVKALAGLLAGSLVSGVVLAISASNSGGGWDNAKKYIEAGAHGGKGTEAHKAAVVGDTVGDPFKDTSGPSLNILMKLMAITSLVFAPFLIKAHQALLNLWGG